MKNRKALICLKGRSKICKICGDDDCKDQTHKKGPGGIGKLELKNMTHIVTVHDNDKILSGWIDKQGIKWIHEMKLMNFGWYKAHEKQFIITNKIKRNSA